jgi:acyl-CoA reductase-like NAD-dependent aldehyde dehydrogenase
MQAMTIDGKAVAAERAFDVVDPAAGEVTAQAPDCTPEQLDRAVTAAARAQREWRTDEEARRKAMLALADAIVAASGELTATLSRETGKPLAVAGAEPAICAAWLQVTFTGSVAGGKSVAVSAAADLKRVTLELGGNDAAILLPDADLATAVPVLAGTAFFNTGQACALPKRIFAPDDRYDEVVEAFAAAAAAMTVGPPSDPAAQLGPLSTRPQFERVKGLAEDAVRRGARVAAGGRPGPGPGFFFEPTIIADIADSAPLVAEEQFGPVLPILRYATVDEAVERANDTTFGLCGSAWGTDAERATAVAERLECGTTFVNTHADLLPTVPFGGSKWSGLGHENGTAGLLAFTEPQVVHLKKAGS